MRWKNKESFKNGQKRCGKRFAWFPTEVQNYTVWLEFYGVTEFFYAERNWWIIIDKNLLYDY